MSILSDLVEFWVKIAIKLQMRLKLSIQPLVGLLAGGRVLGNTLDSGSSLWSPPPPTNPNMESSSFKTELKMALWPWSRPLVGGIAMTPL